MVLDELAAAMDVSTIGRKPITADFHGIATACDQASLERAFGLDQ
ncbi:hypothetical protein [Rhizobium rhizogenes]|nr:hypothetical protein [Rhizobium rhizogenes]